MNYKLNSALRLPSVLGMALRSWSESRWKAASCDVSDPHGFSSTAWIRCTILEKRGGGGRNDIRRLS